MTRHRSTRPCRRIPLAVCLATSLATAAQHDAPYPRLQEGLVFADSRAHGAPARPAPPTGRPAVDHIVTSCGDDSDPGTLRNVIASAVSGDLIDLSSLPCSTIVIENGEIEIPVASLYIEGPLAGIVTIDAYGNSRIFRHTAGGTLYLSELALTRGSYNGDADGSGGCVYTNGSLYMVNVIMTDCHVSARSLAAGGAAAAIGDLTMIGGGVVGNSATIASDGDSDGAAVGGGLAGLMLVLNESTISGNVASSPFGNAYGGGAIANGGASVKYSSFSGNSAIATGPAASSASYGGALAGTHAIILGNSTLDGNAADFGGGVYLRDVDPGSITLHDTTISGNHAYIAGGGLFARDTLSLSNSTIAFNDSGPIGAGGVYATGATIELESTIIAQNLPVGGPFAADLAGNSTVSGANNLVQLSGLSLPADTIDADPRLLPLAGNGGVTRTHALRGDSPAIDAGNNVEDRSYDQRGSPYPRVAGPSADIGAYERDADLVFANGFDAGAP